MYLFFDFKVSHVCVHYDNFSSVFICEIFSPKYYFYNAISNVAVDHKTEVEHVNRILSLIGIVGRNISIADGRNGVNSPIKRVKILYLPGVGIDRRKGCC